MPTRKWWAFVLTTAGTIATAAVVTGSWDKEETTSAIGLVVAAGVAWLLKDDPNNPAS